MFSKIACLASVLTVISFSAVAEEMKIPERSIPLNEKSNKPAAKPAQMGQTTMGTPAGASIMPSVDTPAPVAAPIATPVAGGPSFASAGTGALPNAATPVPVLPVGTGAPDMNATASSSAAAAPVADPAADTRDAARQQRNQRRQNNEARLEDTFEEMDTNHDGMVNESEFSAHYKTTGDNPEFIRYDRNNDGQITRQEYMGGNTVGNSLTPPKDPVSTRVTP